MVLSTTQKYYLNRGILAVACGMSLSSAFAPENMPLFTLISLLVFFYMVAQTQRVWEAALWGLIFGFGWFVSGINWVYYSMYHYGYMPLEWTYVTTCALSFGLGLFPAAAMALSTWLTPNPAWRLALTMPAIFTLTEWLRGWLLTGFPWLNPAYSMVDWSLAGFAPFFGVYGVLYALSLISGLLAAVWQIRGQWLYMAAGVIMAISIAMFGMIGRAVPWAQEVDQLTVHLIQPNYEPRLIKETMQQRFAKTFALLQKAPAAADLVVLPESVYPTSVQRFPVGELERLQNWTTKNNSALLFNAFWEPKAGEFSNAAIMLKPQGAMSVYEKRHLVPFGEFVPYGFQWFIDSMRIPMASLNAGDADQALMQIRGRDVSVNLCYENLFGEEWIDAWNVGNPALLINLSNLKWFGPVRAASQHFQISQMRALETARPLVSATNSGVTGVIDHQGNVMTFLASDDQLALDVKVPMVEGEATPYVRWGNYPVVIFMVLLMIAGAMVSRVHKFVKKQ